MGRQLGTPQLLRMSRHLGERVRSPVGQVLVRAMRGQARGLPEPRG